MIALLPWLPANWAFRQPVAAPERPGGMRASVVVAISLLLVACAPASPTTPVATGELEVTVVAGPVCPVETLPPDPACAPRPVPDARVLVSPGDGREVLVAEATTDEDGIARLELPPGDYIVSGGEVDGLFGLPSPTTATVVAGETTSVTLAYDTGIR